MHIRVEDRYHDGRYVVRAELPGVDPRRQVEVAVAAGVLTIQGERTAPPQGPARSEFRYGRFSRHIPLPAAADEDDIQATCHDGILEVTIGLRPRQAHPARHVPVASHRR